MEVSASQVVGSFPAVCESPLPVYKQVHRREQIAAEPRFVRTQQCTVENIVQVPIPQIQVQSVESVQEIPQERLPERIEEPNKNTPIPHSIRCSAPAPVIEDVSPEPGVSCGSTVPAIKHVAPAPVIEHAEPAPELQPGEIGFDMFGKSCEVIRIGTDRISLDRSGFSTHGKNVDGSSRALGCDAATSLQTSPIQAQEAFLRGGITDFYESDGIHLLKCIIHMCTLCSYQVLPMAGTDSRILCYAVYRVLAGDGVLIYEGLHAILRQVDRDLSEYHMKNLTDQGCSFTVSAEREDCSRDVEKTVLH